MSVLHLRTGSKCPPLKPGTIRLYSMKYCPFAQSTRLVLAHKNIKYELVNIHLKAKPEWFTEKSVLGKTPCLEIGDKKIFDSTICNYYLDAAYAEKKLVPDDPYERAVMEMWIERYNSTVNAPCAYLCWTDADAEKHADTLKGLTEFEKLLSDGRQFFGGENLNMLDIKMYPMLEKADYIKKKRGMDPIPPEKFPKLRAWRERMQNSPAGKGGATDLVNLEKLAEGPDGILDYDVGVKA